MCFICQDTGHIFIKQRGELVKGESCPICNDLSLRELDRIISSHKYYGSEIKSIRMNQKFLDEITRLIPLKEYDEKYDNTNCLLGITITIDNNIPRWEIEYEK